MDYQHEKDENDFVWHGPRPGLPEKDHGLGAMMMNYLASRQLSHHLARYNGWYTAEYKGPRIVIPCSNSIGVPYFQARAMDSNKLRYASPPASRDDSLVIVWPVAKMTGQSVIVEGPMDALAVAEFGFVGIALMGNDPNLAVVQHIVNHVRGKFEPVMIVPDADTLEMGTRVLHALSQRNVRCHVSLLPFGKDLAEMSKKQRKGFLEV